MTFVVGGLVSIIIKCILYCSKTHTNTGILSHLGAELGDWGIGPLDRYRPAGMVLLDSFQMTNIW